MNKINNTPVRTSENYLINNIAINDPEYDKTEFNNCFLQDFDTENIEVTNNVSDFDLTYGNSKELEEQVKQECNVKIRIDFNSNSNKDNIINFIFDENSRTLIDIIEINVNENCKGRLTIRYAIVYSQDENDVSLKKCSNSFCRSNIKCDIAERYLADSKNSGYHNGAILLRMNQNSELNLNVINLLGDTTTNFISIENEIEMNAKLEYNIIDFGGQSSITNYYSNLNGESSENNLNAIYLGKNEQLLDLNYIVSARGKKSKVNIDVQGALKDNAKKHFKGTIDFKRGCKKAEGSENEFCMLLSNDAKSISLPMLLCDEEDVVGNHAAAAGKVNNKELFYLMSRGFTEKEAKTLMVRAKFNKVIDKVLNEGLKDELISEISYRLN